MRKWQNNKNEHGCIIHLPKVHINANKRLIIKTKHLYHIIGIFYNLKLRLTNAMFSVTSSK